jgi:thiol:disulfide interchange protein
VLLPTLARVLRLASIAICLIAVASFAAFALDQTKGASSHQRAKVDEAAPGGAAVTGSSKSKPAHKSGLREALDKAFSTLSSPFSGITSGSNSQWTIQIVDTLLMLFVYGFGLSFVARLLPGRL